jgi:hypothetical protein
VATCSGQVFTNRLSSEVVLVTPNGATATGHCTLSRAGLGTCIFSGGPGGWPGSMPF